MKPLTILIMCTLFSAMPVLAQETGLITTTGEGRVSVQPDMARVSLGVASRDEQASVALANTSEAVADVMDLLERAGVSEQDIRTTNVSLFPLRASRPRDGTTEPEITGFEATNILQVTVLDLESLGEILDRVVQSGANTLNGLSFSVQDPAPHLAQARIAAVQDARARADQLATAAGVSLGNIRSIGEPSGRASPMMEMAAARVSDVPVAPGTITLSGRVTITFEIVQ
ncbi:MAG: SIMPL domain-containing protein [Roseobacter sp.]